MLIIGILLVPFFIYAIITNFIFSRSDVPKDKKDQIVAHSSKYALGIFPIGWLILHLYHNFIASVSYDTYKGAMWVLVLLLFTVQGFAVNYYKKKLVHSDASY